MSVFKYLKMLLLSWCIGFVSVISYRTCTETELPLLYDSVRSRFDETSLAVGADSLRISSLESENNRLQFLRIYCTLNIFSFPHVVATSHRRFYLDLMWDDDLKSVTLG